jgi:hypothetical protein
MALSSLLLLSLLLLRSLLLLPLLLLEIWRFCAPFSSFPVSS